MSTQDSRLHFVISVDPVVHIHIPCMHMYAAEALINLGILVITLY